MKTIRRKALMGFALCLGVQLLTGCGASGAAITSSKVEDRFNPALSAEQRQAIIQHKQQNGDLPSH